MLKFFCSQINNNNINSFLDNLDVACQNGEKQLTLVFPKNKKLANFDELSQIIYLSLNYGFEINAINSVNLKKFIKKIKQKELFNDNRLNIFSYIDFFEKKYGFRIKKIKPNHKLNISCKNGLSPSSVKYVVDTNKGFFFLKVYFSTTKNLRKNFKYEDELFDYFKKNNFNNVVFSLENNSGNGYCYKNGLFFRFYDYIVPKNNLINFSEYIDVKPSRSQIKKLAKLLAIFHNHSKNFYITCKNNPISFNADIIIKQTIERIKSDINSKKNYNKNIPKDIKLILLRYIDYSKKIILNAELNQSFFLHGDIKPYNVLCDGKNLYLTDFLDRIQFGPRAFDIYTILGIFHDSNKQKIDLKLFNKFIETYSFYSVKQLSKKEIKLIIALYVVKYVGFLFYKLNNNKDDFTLSLNILNDLIIQTKLF